MCTPQRCSLCFSFKSRTLPVEWASYFSTPICGLNIKHRPSIEHQVTGSEAYAMAGEPGTPAAKLIDPDTEDPPTPNNGSAACIEQCKFARKVKRGGRQLDMIQCSVCADWYHTECAGVKKDERVGIWPCLSCRLIHTHIRGINDKIIELKTTPIEETYRNALRETINNTMDRLAHENNKFR